MEAWNAGSFVKFRAVYLRKDVCGMARGQHFVCQQYRNAGRV
jgi:hypothetical protein